MEKPESEQNSPFVKDMEPGTYYWCACGQSSNQPFCDGSHKGSKFIPEKVEITDAKKIAWCGCKKSLKGAFCDGMHSKI